MFDPYRKWLGIPEQFRPPTHYQMLGISADEQDREVIEAAVVRQSAYVRNFQNGPNAEHATKLLNEIAAARGCLLDAPKRAAYDALIRPAMGTVVQIPQGTLPIGTAIPSNPLGTQANPLHTLANPLGTPATPLGTQATPLGTQAAAPKAAAAPTGPAATSGLQPIVVRPASWIDTLNSAELDTTTKTGSGAAAGQRPATTARVPNIQSPGSKPQSLIADQLQAPAESMFDQLLAADIKAPAIRRQPAKTQPPRTVILAACGGLAGLLVIIGLATLFSNSASTDEQSRPADSLSKSALATKKKESPRRSPPRRSPAKTQPGAESLDLSLDQPAPMPAARPALPVTPNPDDGASNPSVAELGPNKDALPRQSEPNDPLGRMVPGNSAGTFTDQVPPLNAGFPLAPENNVISPAEMAAQPGQFQPRLKLNEDRSYGEIRRLELTTTHCTVLAFSASGRQLAAGMSNGRVLLWSMEDPQDFKPLNGFAETRIPVTCLAFTPDDKTLMVGTSDGHIRGIAVQEPEQREVALFSEHHAGPRRIAFFRDGAGVISSGDDRTVRIWTLADGKQLNFYGGFKTSVTCLWADETGNRIRASDSRTVGMVNLDSDKPPRNFTISPRATARGTMSHDGRYLVWANGRGLVVRDLTNAREDTPFPDDKTRRAGEVRFSPDDRLLAMANSSDPSITLWDFEDRKKLAELAAHSMPLSDIAFSPDNRLLASGSFDTTLRIWRLPDPETLRTNARKAKIAPAE